MKLNEYEIAMSQAADKMTELYDTIATLHHNLANAQATVEMAMARIEVLEADKRELIDKLEYLLGFAALHFINEHEIDAADYSFPDGTYSDSMRLTHNLLARMGSTIFDKELANDKP